MIIRAVLIICIVALLARVLSFPANANIKAGKKLAVLGFFALAVCAVLFPNLTNRIANFVGVGRGADLLLYCLVITFVGFVISQYVTDKENHHRVVALARHVALLEANASPHNQAIDKKYGRIRT